MVLDRCCGVVTRRAIGKRCGEDLVAKCKAVLALFAGLAAAGSLVGARPVVSKEFTYDEKVNAEMARRLKIPVYFAVPASARLALPNTIDTTDRLIDFKHPDGKGAQGDVGLRLVVAKRAGFSQRLGKSGLVQTGDLLLTFRSEWGGAGAYPNVQMGISHTGVAWSRTGCCTTSIIRSTRNIWGPATAASSTASITAPCSSCTSSARATSPMRSAPTSSPGRRASPAAPGASIPRS